MTRMRLPFQVKLILSFACVCLFIGILSLSIGTSIINRGVLNEATNRISQDLNAAWEIFYGPLTRSVPTFEIAAGDAGFVTAILDKDVESASKKLNSILSALSLDYAGLYVVGNQGRYLRASDGRMAIRSIDAPSYIEFCIDRKIPQSGVAVLPRDLLMAEDPMLAEQARVAVIPTARAEPRNNREETSGMALVTAFPVLSDGKVIAVLYGGTLLSGNNAIVDRIRDTVFRQETYRGFNIGTATIFFGDLRIATNVMYAAGNRAIGTQVSKEVKESVLENGLRWTDRAFVVNNWYITAYDPIVDLSGNRIGMLYVGVLESKYRDIRFTTLRFFIIIIAGGIIIAIALGFFLGRILLRPINRLVDASEQVSDGDLEPDIGPISRDEIGVLQKTFTTMLRSFQERVAQQERDSTDILLQSEKQASVGRLAAGVAHEINNPLSSVLTFSHLLLERSDLPADAKKDLEVIAESTDRVRHIVRALLDYSRQDQGQADLHPVPTDINELISSTIAMVESQIRGTEIRLLFTPVPDLPLVTLDKSQIQSVIINLLLNAADALEKKGTITLSMNLSVSTDHSEQTGVDILVTDTGKGIAPAHMDRLFDPFFTTKAAGKGTGLGLAVSQRIIERHGGSIRVRSAVGNGSTFEVWLPLTI